MAKAVKVLCDRCECKLIAGVPFCRQCGYPTRWATHEERTSWEVAQWKTADRSHAPKSPSKEARRWNPFARKADAKPALTVIHSDRPKIAESPAVPTADAPSVATAPEPAPAPAKAAPPAPARVVASVPSAPRPERIAPRVKPAVKAKPAPAPAPSVTPGPRDAEPLTDTPATVMAMRLLNARVAELDEKIQRLERELQGTPQIRRSQ